MTDPTTRSAIYAALLSLALCAAFASPALAWAPPSKPSPDADDAKPAPAKHVRGDSFGATDRAPRNANVSSRYTSYPKG